MAIEVEQSVNVATGPESVWRLLADPNSWKSWWPDCVDAHVSDYKVLREGSELVVVVQPQHSKLTFRPTVDLYTEQRTLSLTHRTVFFACTAAWYLQPREDGTRVTVRAVLAGPAAFLLRLLRRDAIVRLTLHSQLRGLKKVAERMV